MSTTTAIPGVAPSLLAEPDLCTLQTCPLVLAHVQYVPSLAGNALYLSIFGLALVIQIGLGYYYRTWGYLAAMFDGIVLEILGYVARVQMHYNPFSRSPFLMYLVCLTIGPAFLAAAIYLCLSRIVVVYSEQVSFFKPRTYTLLFITFDFFALLLQAAGGGIASGANNSSSLDKMGKDIMVAGVSWQVFSLALFALLSAEYAWRVHRAAPSELNPDFHDLRSGKRFQIFLWSLGVATLTMFIRSVFRCAELSGGFRGKLANQQVTFMILEGAMICISVICLTTLHPGVVFKSTWYAAIWSVRGKKSETDAIETKIEESSRE